jgi:nucleoside phosphorylase
MYFANSGNLEDLLSWFHSHQPSLLEPSWDRTHPAFLCLLVPGGRASRSFLVDVIEQRNSLNLLLGADIAFFVFGALKVECAIPSYGDVLERGAGDNVDVSHGLGVWRPRREAHRRPESGFLFWTIDHIPDQAWRRDFPEIEGATTSFADQVIHKFHISVSDLPALVLLYADPKVSPWIVRLESDTDASRLFALVKDVRTIVEDAAKGLAKQAGIRKSDIVRALEYPEAFRILEGEFDAIQQTHAAILAEVNKGLEEICGTLSLLGLKADAITFLRNPSGAHNLLISLGYKVNRDLPPPLREYEASLEVFRSKSENCALVREVTKKVHSLTLAMGTVRAKERSIRRIVQEYESTTRQILELPDQQKAYSEAEGTLLRRLNKAVAAAQPSFAGPTIMDLPARITELIAQLAPLREEFSQLEQIKRSTGGRPVLVVCVTDIEMQALRDAFAAETGQRRQPTQIGRKEYFELGTLNTNSVLLTRTEMGAVSPGSSLQSVAEAIQAVRPISVLLVGIAFGVDEAKQAIGNVLVSKQLFQYESQKISVDGVIFRGDRVSASTWLLEKFRNAALDWKGAKVEFGLLLTGEKLIDNYSLREQLRGFEPEAIGGEMEGAGLYSACRERNVDWIIIKAICDWAHNKGVQKEERQRLAAKNCAEFIVHAMKTSIFACIGTPQ